MTTLAVGTVAGTAPVGRRIRAYFAPVNRASGVPAGFDAAMQGGFDVENAPAPWIDLGWCAAFTRKCGTKVEVLRGGAPGAALGQVRSEVEATVSLEFDTWGKLQLALAAGMQQMNLLVNGTAVAVGTGSTGTVLQVGAGTAGFAVGDLVAVDVDYAGQTGYLGTGVSGAYVSSPTAVGGDTDYVRRVTLNVGRVTAVAAGTVTVGAPLAGGAPVAGMKVQGVRGFSDREGATFFQEWSGLFVLQGEQGDRVIFYYPRLQAMAGATEVVDAVGGTFERLRLAGAFRALAVKDANDGEMVLCYRSYLPAAMRAV